MASEAGVWTGEVIDGFTLGRLIEYSERGALLETEFGSEALPSVIRVREAGSEDNETTLAGWRDAIALEHPNVLRTYAAGASVLNHAPIVYAVMERPDESLGNVVAERALSAEETRRVLDPALAGLKYLHNQGYTVPGLTASQLVAVGDQLKISAENIVRAGAGASTAEDVRALGALVVQALTQKIPEVGRAPDAATMRDIPSPLKEFVWRCLNPDVNRRWSAEEAEAFLRNPDAPVVPSFQPAATEQLPSSAMEQARAEAEQWPSSGRGAL